MLRLDDTEQRRLKIAGAIFGVCFLVAAITIPQYGITWDEPTYVAQAKSVGAWYGMFMRSPSQAITEDTITAHWPVWSKSQRVSEGNRNVQDRLNPPMILIVGSAVAGILDGPLDTFTAYRLVGCLSFAAIATVLFLWGSQKKGIKMGLFAAAFFAVMPRMFADAHFFATDMPAAAAMLAAMFVLAKSDLSWKRAVVGGVALGFAFAFKFTSLVAPAILLIAMVLGRNFKAIPKLIVSGIIGSVFFIIVYPGLWHDPIGKIAFFLAVTAERSRIISIPTMYLGDVYRFDLPTSHPWVMVFGTIPAITALLAVVGIAAILRNRDGRCVGLVHVVAFAMLMVGFMTPQAPGHDGARLFESVFPFIAMMAAFALDRISANIGAANIRNMVCALALLPGLLGIVRWHPYELSYYGGLVGGPTGALALGLETTYWGDVLDSKNEAAIRDAIAGSPMTFRDVLEPVTWRIEKGRFGAATVTADGYWTLLFARQGMLDDATRLGFEMGTPKWELRKNGIRLAALFETARMYDGVFERLDKTSQFDPRAVFCKGLVMEATGNPERALEFFDRASAMKDPPERVEIHRGKAFVALGRYKDAVQTYREILGRGQTAEVWFELGRSFEAAGNREAAREAYLNAVKIHADYPGALTSLYRVASPAD